MLEPRSSYGYEKVTYGRTSKWMVGYRTYESYSNYGEFGDVFNTKVEAEAFGEKMKEKYEWIHEIIVKHPSRISSGY